MKNEDKIYEEEYEKKILTSKEQIQKNYSIIIEDIFEKQKNELIMLEKYLIKSLPKDILNCKVETLKKNNFDMSLLLNNPKKTDKIYSTIRESILNKRECSQKKKEIKENFNHNRKIRFATPIKKKKYYFPKSNLRSFSNNKKCLTEFKLKKKMWRV